MPSCEMICRNPHILNLGAGNTDLYAAIEREKKLSGFETNRKLLKLPRWFITLFERASSFPSS
jgi:hypothetical protein